ncbi:iron uptake system protein EfeO [Rathayibacter soli]|uniref:iron uptake system protein EfeO n=1 Tax=Rathayibacter soli TaxID=3144168 RepID=UPI0027E53EF9|nr:iron uptake system protein EfeO [Glaciibacter superstes]
MQPSRRSRRGRSAIATLVTAAALAVTGSLAGCSTDGASADAPAKSGIAQVSITLASDGSNDTCALSATSAPAGPVTFTVKNESSTAITEVELLSQQRIIGEKENLAPGLKPVSFTLTLGGGTYQVQCPGAQKETQTFTVTGKAATPTGSVQSILKQGTDGYATYVTGVVTAMVTAVHNLTAAVDSGNLAEAQNAYALARPFYERIESDVAGFTLPGFAATDNAGNLDYLIDMRASNLDDAVGWHGFHAVERDLFQNKAITPSAVALAAELQRNVLKLQTLAKKLAYKPEDLANGAAGLLEEVQSSKIKGEEEQFSHIDLVDFAANVEGAQQAFAFLKPGMKKIDANLTARISKQFEAVNTMLEGYRDPSALGGYVSYTAQLRSTDANKLSQAVQALQDPLSTIAEKVATAH